jgi:hypothetical protein
MCDPVSLTVALTGLTIGKEVAGLAGQAQAYNQNAASAAQSLRLQNRQTNLGIQQKEASNSLKAQQTQSDMLKAAATAAATAGENGISGNSVDALINEYHASEGRYFSSLQTQAQWDRTQADVTKQGQVAQAQRQVNSVAKPDYIGAALRIAGSGLDAYDRTHPKDATR